MPEYTASGISQDQVNALISAAVATAVQALPQYVNNGQFQTVAQLLTNFPASASTLGMLGRVSDLWGSVRTAMICEQDTATGYYWRPQRTDYAPIATAITAGTLTLTPLVSAPQILITNGLTGNLTITPSTTNVWPGAQFRVQMNGLLNLLNVNITGLVGGGTLPLLTGGVKTLVYHSGSGWAAG